MNDGNFNSIRAILEDDNLPEIPRKSASVTGEKFGYPLPPGAAEHDRKFKPGGVKAGKLNSL